MCLWAAPHWVAESSSTNIEVRRNHTAHLEIAYLHCFDLNNAIGRLVKVDEDVVGFDV
jgi:hypothetical protein